MAHLAQNNQDLNEDELYLVYIFRNQITMTPSTGVTDRCPCHRLDRLTDLADKRHSRRRLSQLPRQAADHWNALPLPLRFKLVVLAKIRPDESSRGASPHEYLARHIAVYGPSTIDSLVYFTVDLELMDSLLDQFEKVSFNLEVPVDSMFLGVLNGASHLRRIEFIGQLLPRFVLRYLRTEPVINWVSQKWKLQELEVANLTSWPDEYKATLMYFICQVAPTLRVLALDTLKQLKFGGRLIPELPCLRSLSLSLTSPEELAMFRQVIAPDNPTVKLNGFHTFDIAFPLHDAEMFEHIFATIGKMVLLEKLSLEFHVGDRPFLKEYSSDIFWLPFLQLVRLKHLKVLLIAVSTEKAGTKMTNLYNTLLNQLFKFTFLTLDKLILQVPTLLTEKVTQPKSDSVPNLKCLFVDYRKTTSRERNPMSLTKLMAFPGSGVTTLDSLTVLTLFKVPVFTLNFSPA